ncbi:uncharacterized protein LOC127115068 [Lathyrus oleraceus]|uniref:uncharacterized protein LOC127115068 n=1 Tax=Pisum sativum TaxID=3888 RepID=UPI0021CF5D47|nr:uncharacterized protein LOC127115068 [Pisum sativum]
MQTVEEFDTTVGEASEDESPPHPGLHVAPQGDDIEMEVVVEDDPEDGAARDGDNQLKRTEVEPTSTRNTPPAPDRAQGSGKSTAVKIPAKKAVVEVSPSTAKKPSTKVSRKPPTIQTKKSEEERGEDKVPNEESGDESPELIPPPQKKKKLTKVSSQRSIVNPTRKDSASTPPAKPQSKDTGSGKSGFNTEIPEEQVAVERTLEKILEETAPEEDIPTSDHDMQTVAEFDTTVGEASEDESPPHPRFAPQGDDIDMEVVVEDDPEDGATRDGDNQSKRTEAEHTSTRNTPPAPDRTQGSGKSTVLEENSLAHIDLKKILKQVNVLEASAEIGSFVMELMTLIDLATVDLHRQRDLTN